MLYKLCLIGLRGMNLIIHIFIYYSYYHIIFRYLYICYSITLFGSTHFILSNWYFHGLFGGSYNVYDGDQTFLRKHPCKARCWRHLVAFEECFFPLEYQPLKQEHITDHIFLFANSRKISYFVMYRLQGVYYC